MYGLAIPVHSTSGNPVTVRNDTDLCNRLRTEGVDESTIYDIIRCDTKGVTVTGLLVFLD